MRYFPVTLAAALVIALAGCQRNDSGSDDAGFLANAPAEAKTALSSPVDFQLNEDNFAKWEIAQRNLDRVPASEFSNVLAGGSPFDRAVARIESSPRARKAIESSGLSVRDFVLETVALAQSVQASRLGRSTAASRVAAENFAFVERYRDRIRQSGSESDVARQSGDAEVTDPNTRAELEAANANRVADSIAQSNSATVDSLVRIHGGDSAADTLEDSQSALRR